MLLSYTHMNHPFSVTYIGHATLLIEMNGVRILTDPVLGSHVGGFIRRQTPVPTVHCRDVDVVLISHLHLDHLDLPSLRLLPRSTPLVVPTGAGRVVQRLGFTRVTEVRVGDQVRIGEVMIETTPANHGRARAPFRPYTACVGFLLHGEQTVYFAGDTDLFPEMSGLVHKLDVALLPVWGWGPTLGTGHMDPRRAAEALPLLKPGLAIPIHWGTLYPLAMRYWRPNLLSAPPHLFAHHARELAPDVRILIVKPGQAFHSFG